MILVYSQTLELQDMLKPQLVSAKPMNHETEQESIYYALSLHGMKYKMLPGGA